jgi:hypothetical protein
MACRPIGGRVVGKVVAPLSVVGKVVAPLSVVGKVVAPLSASSQALVALLTEPLNADQRRALYRKVDCAKARCTSKEDRRKLEEHVQGYTR